MHCHNCGKEIQGGMKFCPHCGQDQAIVVPQDQRIPTEDVEGIPPPRPLFNTDNSPQQGFPWQVGGLSRKWQVGLLGCGGVGLLLLALIVVTIVSGAPDNTATRPDNTVTSGEGIVQANGDDANESESARQGGADRADQQQISVDETAELEDHTFSVEEVERNYSSGDEFSSPQSGKDFMRVWVNIKNTSSNRSVSFNPFSFEVEDSKGIQQGSTYVGEVPYEFESGELAPGGTVEGNIIFEVPQNDNNLKLLYEANMFSGEYITVEPLQ